jgi:hypothetical protein
MKNNDEILFEELQKLKLSKQLDDVLNIYFTYKKIKKGCYINLGLYNNIKQIKKFENILTQYKLKYKKYQDKILYYFISKKVNPTNIDFMDTKYKLNDIELGKFLGYGYVHNLDKDKPCEKGILLSVEYVECNKNIYSYIYTFCCLKIDINLINNTLKIVNKMNYYIKKYLSNKLKGIVRLSIIKI